MVPIVQKPNRDGLGHVSIGPRGGQICNYDGSFDRYARFALQSGLHDHELSRYAHTQWDTRSEDFRGVGELRAS